MGGLNRKRHFDLLRDKLGMDVAPNYSNENTLSAYLSDLNLSISPYSVRMRENTNKKKFENFSRSVNSKKSSNVSIERKTPYQRI